MTWRDIFQESYLVKNASAEDLDTNNPNALVVAGYRIDNPAAAWVSQASIKTDTIKGLSISKIAAARVAEACSLFGITDNDFQLKDTTGYNFMVKEAGHTADFCILTEDSFHQAVQAVFEKRASAPYDFCRKCAEALSNIQEAEGYLLSDQDAIKLQKLASTVYFNADATAAAIKARADYASNYLKDTKEVASLNKLAAACENIPYNGNTIVPMEIVRTIDMFDRKYNLMGKFASHRVKPIEEIAYMTHDEALVKEASTLLEIDDVRTITKKPFMVPEYCDMMAKWASDNGYATTTEPEDILDCVSSMSESLREEFVQTFGNL